MPNSESLSALITVVIVIAVVVVPLSLFGIQLSDEVRNLYTTSVTTLGEGDLIPKLTEVANRLVHNFSPVSVNTPVFDVADTENYIIQVLTWLRGHFGDIFSGLAKLAVGIFLFLISFFYLIRDGEKLRKSIVALSPMKDDRDELIMQKLQSAVHSIVKGSIFVAIIQGALSIAGFSFFGLPSPVLWGGVAMVAALIPGLGTSIVIVPAILYLFFSGNSFGALGLLIWGALAVGFIDNLLGPKLIGKGVQIHPLLILLSALGGISFFGAVGFILGPITLSFLFALLDIYKTLIVRDYRA